MVTDDDIGRALVGAWRGATEDLTPPEALVERAVARGRRRVAAHRVVTAAGTMSVAGATVAVTALGNSTAPPARTVPAASATASGSATAASTTPTEPTPSLDPGWAEATVTPAFVKCLEAKGYGVGKYTYDPRLAPAPAPDTEFTLVVGKRTNPAFVTGSDPDLRAAIDADVAACRSGG